MVINQDKLAARLRDNAGVSLADAVAVLCDAELGFNYRRDDSAPLEERIMAKRLASMEEALIAAIKAHTLAGTLVEWAPDLPGMIVLRMSVYDPRRSTIGVADLRAWADGEGIACRAFDGLPAAPGCVTPQPMRKQRRGSVASIMAALVALAGDGRMPYEKAVLALRQRLADANLPATDDVRVAEVTYSALIVELARAADVDRRGGNAAIVRVLEGWPAHKVGATVVADVMQRAASGRPDSRV